MGFEWHKYAEPSAPAGLPCRFATALSDLKTHIPAQIKRAGISSPICRTGPVHPIHRIVEKLAGISQRNRAAQLRSNPAAWQKIVRQRIIRKSCSTIPRCARCRSQAAATSSPPRRSVIIQHIIQLRETQIDGGRVTGTGGRVILENEIKAGLEQNIVPAAIQKDGRKIRQQK